MASVIYQQFSAKRGRERKRKKEISKAEKRDAEYSICKWPQSPSSRLKRTLLKLNCPCESKQRICKYSACPHHACIKYQQGNIVAMK